MAATRSSFKAARGTALERFLDRIVVLPNECWQWQGTLVTQGYGYITDDHGWYARAHRWSYEHFVGPIPAGLVLDHLCRNRGCVNPDHVEPTTHAININRGETRAASRKRRQKYCKRGHDLALTAKYVPSKQSRQCMACMREYSRDYHARKREQVGS